MKFSRLFSTILILLASVQVTMAEPITIGETSTLFSKILDEERTLMISLPNGYEGSTTGYPVVYLLDARTRFHHTAANAAALARIGHIPEMIVVGITNTRRTRDFTPAWTHPDQPVDPAMGRGGGADEFLAFLRKELVPHVEATYRTKPFRILVGHSLGGLFGVHALVSDPELFQAILAISPSLWWDEGKAVERATDLFRERPELKGHLYLTLGDEGEDMLDNFKAFRTLLLYRAPQGLRWKAEVLPGEDHGSVPVPGVDRGLRFFFPRWRIPAFVAEEGLASIDQHYADLSEHYGFPISTPENMINNLGYVALAEQKREKALEFFRANVERYPGSPNAYDSLGEGLEVAEKFEEAKKAYVRAIELGKELNDPGPRVYQEHLEAFLERLRFRE